LLSLSLSFLLRDACGAAVAFGATGFALGFGGNSSGESSFVGSKHFFLSGDVDAAVFFFQFTFSATAATIVAGTLAERCRMAAYLLYSMILTGFVYPVVAHAVCKWSINYSGVMEGERMTLTILSSFV
jgi:Amt family ammonium transporter